MQDLLSCSILRDGMDYIIKRNKIAKESVRYRWLYNNYNMIDIEHKHYDINNLENWLKWYTFNFCKQDVPCLESQTYFCDTTITEIPKFECTSDLTIIEI